MAVLLRTRASAVLLLGWPVRAAPVADEELTAAQWLREQQMRGLQGLRAEQQGAMLSDLSMLQGAPSDAAPLATQRAYLDMAIGGAPAGRLVFDLFGDVAPRTVRNFASLVQGEPAAGGGKRSLRGSRLHRIIGSFMAQGGDYDGRGGDSLWGGTFADESFALKHNAAGTLSMANYGKDTNKAQFFVTFKATPHLDGKHVVFGRLQSGFEALKKVEAVGSRSGKPTADVVIQDCGILPPPD